MFRGLRTGLTSLASLRQSWRCPTGVAGELGILGWTLDAGAAQIAQQDGAKGTCYPISRLRDGGGCSMAGFGQLRGFNGAAGNQAQFVAKQSAFAPADKMDIKAQVVFDSCWRNLESKYKNAIVCPKEIVWLNGAPGAGKGVNTPFILQSRNMTRAVPMSSVLDQPGIREIMDRGELVPDTMVGDALLDVIFDPEKADGAGLIMDGFPRTALQVEFLKLLYDKMMALHVAHADSPDEWRFPRPSFKIVVLYVEMEESIRRQVKRARMADLHNQRVLDAGTGELLDVRPTDADISKCRRRYEVFKAHYSTLLRLKQYFPFSLIDAMGSLDECKAQIARELRYQSSHDLQEATYAAIRHLPLARELVRSSRQQLVSHLDAYCKKHHTSFMQVIHVIDEEVLPLLRRCSLAGHAVYKTHAELFRREPLAADMFIDILTDRGFSVAYYLDELVIPESVDLTTGAIKSHIEGSHHFRITFEKSSIRDTTSAMSLATTPPEQQADKLGHKVVAIGGSFSPAVGPVRERLGNTPSRDLERKPEPTGDVQEIERREFHDQQQQQQHNG